jgi:hypothetical protein
LFPEAKRSEDMETYQVPNGKPHRNWQAVFDDAQPLPWTAFNTGYISGELQNNAQPESFPRIEIPQNVTTTPSWRSISGIRHTAIS